MVVGRGVLDLEVGLEEAAGADWAVVGSVGTGGSEVMGASAIAVSLSALAAAFSEEEAAAAAADAPRPPPLARLAPRPRPRAPRTLPRALPSGAILRAVSGIGGS